MSDIADLTARMRSFTEERDWSQFHDPKSLILALVGEVGELAELFQWLPAEGAVARAAQQPLKDRCGEEMSDVLLYLLRLADVLSINLTHAANKKLDTAHARFVAKDVLGTAPIKS